MISTGLLVIVALVLAAALVVQLALLLAHAAWSGARRRRLAPLLTAARAAVAQTVDGRSDPNAAAQALLDLPMRCRIKVLADLAPTLRGIQRERLELLARDTGVLATAERWTHSRPWWRRLHAARVYSLLGNADAPVNPLLDDRAWEVRAEAAGWAGDYRAQPLIERLIEMLDDPEPLPRFAAKDALRRIGKPAAGPLTRLLEGAEHGEAAAALDVAVVVVDPGMLDAALRLRNDELPEVRVRAAVLLGALGGEAAVDALTAMLADAHPAPRAAAAHALGKLGHWPAAGALADRLRDSDWEVRRTAALALRGLDAPGLLLLRRALDGEDAFASDIARQVLDLPESAEEAMPS